MSLCFILIFLTYSSKPFVRTRFNRKRHVDFKDVFPVYSCRVYILTPSELKCRVSSACCEENRRLVLSYNLLMSQLADFSLHFVNLILERRALVTGYRSTPSYQAEFLVHIWTHEVLLYKDTTVYSIKCNTIKIICVNEHIFI